MLTARSAAFRPASDSLGDPDDLLVGERLLRMVPFVTKARGCKISHFRWTTFLGSGHVEACSAEYIDETESEVV